MGNSLFLLFLGKRIILNKSTHDILLIHNNLGDKDSSFNHHLFVLRTIKMKNSHRNPKCQLQKKEAETHQPRFVARTNLDPSHGGGDKDMVPCLLYREADGTTFDIIF